ncbi:MAG: class I SAM-dependent methyltransferase [Ferruginibacter sp.]|nr:class I SAM-dependent methyltransferase [Bacteroidota bacterium]MBX2919087.1 class I SAM-dependent methyltransferase [Ferruginibacter sp.]MCC7379321.1 class I SAM-dependent methyltransferase [Chitinophagaceae bacterium]
MKIIEYIRYFYFLFLNWNFKIAWYMIWQEINGEKKYGIHTTGADELKQLEKLGIDTSHATLYMPVSYSLLEEIFEQLPALPRTHFVDIGCGKGRALCVAAYYGFKNVTGIDFSKKLCEDATSNLALTQIKIPSLQYQVINNDAFYFEIPGNADCIFLFNPFDEIIMSAVVKNIKKSLQRNHKTVNIVYVNPLHKTYFLNAGFAEVWHSKKLKYIEAVILSN